MTKIKVRERALILQAPHFVSPCVLKIVSGTGPNPHISHVRSLSKMTASLTTRRPIRQPSDSLWKRLSTGHFLFSHDIPLQNTQEEEF